MKNKNPLKILLSLIILDLLFFSIYGVNKENKIDKISVFKNYHNNEVINEDLITEESELNKEVVAEYFVEGMAKEDYLNALNYKTEYLDIEGDYKKIEYDFEKHLHYEDFLEFFKKLALSNIVKLEVIGQSADYRDIVSVEIGNGEKVTIFEAGIHAAEIANPLFICRFMIDLVNNYEDGDKQTIELLENNKIVVIPFVNPDGYEAALFGTETIKNKDLYLSNLIDVNLNYLKMNANGVDLNRNFPSQTAGLYYQNNTLHYTVSKVKTANRYSYYPGETLGSESETRALIYIQNKWIDKLKTYVSLHSAGRSIYNGKPYLSDEYNNESNNAATIVKDITGYQVYDKNDEDAGLGNDGTSSEFMAERLSGFIFSSVTGRLSSDYYQKYYEEMKYKGTGVIVIESLENYTFDLNIIKNEYYKYHLAKAYEAIIQR